MKSRINLGVIGCGGIAAKVLVPAAAAIRDFRMRAFADISEERATALAGEYKGSYHTTDVDRLIGDPELDAIMICTWPDSHSELAIRCLGAGKFTFIQKPAAVTYEQCRALAVAERKAKARAMVAYCYRLSPLTGRLHELLPQPKLIHARMMAADVMKSHKHYLDNPALGAPMLEMACHNVDMVYWLMGSKPVKISAFGGNMHHTGVDVVDNFAMNVQFANGGVASIVNVDNGAEDFARKWFTEAYGDGITATIKGFRSLTVTGRASAAMEVDYNVGIGISNDMVAFRDYIVGSKPSPATAEDGVVATLMMLKAFESLKSGKTVSIDVDALLQEPKQS